MKGILSTVLLLLIWALPTIIKAVKEAKNPTPKVKTPMPDEYLEEEDVDLEMNTELQQNRSNVPNEQEYFTYEKIDAGEEYAPVCSQNKVDSKSQTAVNEEENEYSLTLEEKEVYKGIIYSEILKKKYN